MPEQSGSSLNAQGVRNGHVSGQIAVTSAEDIADLRVHTGPMRQTGGKTIPRSAVQVRYPQFVPVADSDGDDTTAPLREHGSVDVEAGTAQPVWLTIAVPKHTDPGTYTGEVTVTAADREPVTYELSLEVSPVTLRDPEDLDFRTDYWFQPDPVAEFHDVEPWSDEHWDLMETYLRDMVTRGQKSHRRRHHRGSVVGGGRRRHLALADLLAVGKPDHVAQRWQRVELRLREVRPIHRAAPRAGDRRRDPHLLPAVLRRPERFTYLDADGEKVVEDVELGSPRWREGWTAFLSDFRDDMQERGWMDKTFLAFDERPAEVMAEVTALLEDAAPELPGKLSIASYHGDVEDIASDYSMKGDLVADFPIETTRERRAEGKTTTSYTIGSDPTPNTVASIPPIGSRMLGWTSAKADLDGMLRWSYNSSPGDVYEAGTFRYAKGDEYIVYPGENGPVSSISWEMFRDGIEDAELVHMLRTRTGQDSPVLDEIFDDVRPREPATPEQHAALLEAREQLVDELERTGELRATVTAEAGALGADDLVAGERTRVDVEVTDPAGSEADDVHVDLSAPDGWTVSRLDEPEARPSLARRRRHHRGGRHRACHECHQSGADHHSPATRA